MNGAPLPHEGGSPRPRRFARPAPGPEDKSSTRETNGALPTPTPLAKTYRSPLPSPKQKKLPLPPPPAPVSARLPPTPDVPALWGSGPIGVLFSLQGARAAPQPQPPGDTWGSWAPPLHCTSAPLPETGVPGRPAGRPDPSEGGNELGPGLPTSTSERSFRSAPGPGRAPRAHSPRPEPRNLCPAPPLRACARRPPPPPSPGRAAAAEGPAPGAAARRPPGPPPPRARAPRRRRVPETRGRWKVSGAEWRRGRCGGGGGGGAGARAAPRSRARRTGRAGVGGKRRRRRERAGRGRDRRGQ
ncbi:unnamed protein product [Rangifer tarandus platyrhynchus]|uniref:Basic proline-rich protein-like n=1 Tax=Rangifer tarandus platyrhynchus TaxID=3082113 RepID=A0ABN9A1G0_RANTA|nr:unnamed protein product [Rangifer tarandus platyrhynchus]